MIIPKSKVQGKTSHEWNIAPCDNSNVTVETDVKYCKVVNFVSSNFSVFQIRPVRKFSVSVCICNVEWVNVGSISNIMLVCGGWIAFHQKIVNTCTCIAKI